MTEPFNGLKVGDRVVFKTWDEMVAQYGDNHIGDNAYIRIPCCGPDGCVFFLSVMRFLCGREGTISSLYYSHGGIDEVELDDIDIPASPWAIVPNMLKLWAIVPNMLKKIESPLEFADVDPDGWLDFLIDNEETKGEI